MNHPSIGTRRQRSFNSTMTDLVSLSKASQILGVTTRTLVEWDNSGKIQTVRTPGNHRRIPMSEIERLQGEDADEQRVITLAYCRCSTEKQKENLERQVGRVLEHCLKNGWQTELFKDIGSGLNEERREFKKLLKRIPDPDVKRVVVEYKDRLTRFGFETFTAYCKGFGVEVIVLEQAEVKEFEQEMAEDLVSLVTSYSARMYGRRGGRKRKVANDA